MERQFDQKREGVNAQHLVNKSKGTQGSMLETKRTKLVDTPRIVKTEQ
jgi:hypothetical protein